MARHSDDEAQQPKAKKPKTTDTRKPATSTRKRAQTKTSKTKAADAGDKQSKDKKSSESESKPQEAATPFKTSPAPSKSPPSLWQPSQPKFSEEVEFYRKHQEQILNSDAIKEGLPPWKVIEDARVGINDGDIEQELRILHLKTNQFATESLPEQTELKVVQPVLVQKPGSELTALYKKMFGTKMWLSRATELMNPTRFSAYQLVCSIMGAWLLENVLEKPCPWSVKREDEQLNGAVWTNLEKRLEDEGLHFGQLLNRATSDIAREDPVEAKEVIDHITDLSDRLAYTILPQIVELQQSESQTDEWCARIDRKEWKASIEWLVKRAVLLRGRMDTTPMAKYEWTWSNDGGVMQRREMEAVMDQGDAQKVAICLMPGVKVRRYNILGAFTYERVAKDALVQSYAEEKD